MSFLEAEWRKLILVNYEVDEKILKPYLPFGTELDYWKGKAYVSVVGFMFLNTKILGIKIPFHTNFEEVNLRFYVKHLENNEWKRGVVFIKEIVPRIALSFVANNVYKEHYETMPMSHKWAENKDDLHIEYQWKYNNEQQKIKVISELTSTPIMENSDEEFISEHYWGYTKINERSSYEYGVTHPKWEYYPIKDYEVKLDFNAVYGKSFKHLEFLKPDSVMLMEGSKITVENKRKITRT